MPYLSTSRQLGESWTFKSWGMKTYVFESWTFNSLDLLKHDILESILAFLIKKNTHVHNSSWKTSPFALEKGK
jgi:hypothetical protein